MKVSPSPPAAPTPPTSVLATPQKAQEWPFLQKVYVLKPEPPSDKHTLPPDVAARVIGHWEFDNTSRGRLRP